MQVLAQGVIAHPMLLVLKCDGVCAEGTIIDKDAREAAKVRAPPTLTSLASLASCLLILDSCLLFPFFVGFLRP
jgi:hypothetical protein